LAAPQENTSDVGTSQVAGATGPNSRIAFYRAHVNLQKRDELPKTWNQFDALMTAKEWQAR